MDEEKFDSIIVGGGLAGLSAAYKMVQEGLNVVVVERGNYSGAKNMTGGRIYTHSLEKLIPNFREIAPLERKITKEKVSILSETMGTTFEYTEIDKKANAESYTILRGKFDQWLAEQIEEMGAFIVSGVQVTELLMDGDTVIGVKAGEDELYASTVIIADGVNSMLAENMGVRNKVAPKDVAVGIKDVYELSETIINDRFNNDASDGTAWLSMGEITHGSMGGGFIYTNKNTISVGLVVGLEHIEDNPRNIEEMMNEFTSHPTIAPLLKDGKLIEHSGHMVPEQGYNAVTHLSGNGYLIAGDAAGLCINIGYTVRGMDLAVESGIHAAETIIQAIKENNFSGQFLKQYDEKIKNSPSLGKDLLLYKNTPKFLENKRIFTEYPALVNHIVHDVFEVSDEGAKPILGKVLKHVKKVGILNIMKDAWNGVKSL